MALPPITDYRMTPPVDSVGDKRLERSRRDFMDLIRSDEQKQEGNSRGRNREQQSGDQGKQAQDAQRPARSATDQNRERAMNAIMSAPANANQLQPQRSVMPPRQGGASRQAPTNNADVTNAASVDSARSAGSDVGAMRGMSPTARAIMDTPIAPVLRRDPQLRDDSRQASHPGRPTTPQAPVQPGATAAQPNATQIPVLARQPDASSRSQIRPEQRGETAIPATPASVARYRWPEPPVGSSLVSASPSAAALNLVAAPQLQQEGSFYRLSSEVPREVTDRISQFMLTGILNRSPFSFSPVSTVVEEAGGAAVPEYETEAKSADALGALSSSLMRASLGKLTPKPHTAEDLVAQQTTTTTIADSPQPLAGSISRIVPQEFGKFASPDYAPARDHPFGKTVPAGPSSMMLTSLSEQRQRETKRGNANPFFENASLPVTGATGSADDLVVNLIAGPRSQVRRDRIA